VLHGKIALGQTTSEITSQLAEQETKLATNIKLDQANAGKASMTVNFTCGS
jgi:hypothetical protein